MRFGIFTKSVLLLLLIYVGLKSIQPPLVSSLTQMYMGMTIVAILIYVSVNSARLNEWLAPLKFVVFEERAKIPRICLMILFPFFLSYAVYCKVAPQLEPPAALRIIHPAPPAEISVKGKKMALAGMDNPFRVEDKDKLNLYIKEGKKIYYQNCFYCHGDTLSGDGHFAQGFNPLPASFADAGTIAQLQESYVFWRVAKGGPDLPNNAQPWNSAMPVWENMLSEEEMWKAILWIYEGSGHHPRTLEKHQ